MSDTRRSNLLMVLAANFVLFALLALALVNGSDSEALEGNGLLSQKQNTSSSSSKPAADNPDGAKEEKLSGAGTAAQTALPPTKELKSRRSSQRDGKSSGDEPAGKPRLTRKFAESPDYEPLPIAALPPPPPMVPDTAETKPAAAEVQKKESPFAYNLPTKIAGLSITGVIGDKALLVYRPPGKRRVRPELFCVSAGEEVRTSTNIPITVVAVEPYRVTLDIDGDRFVKSLPEIR